VSPCHEGESRRKITHKQQRLLDRAIEGVTSDSHDGPPLSDVPDAALLHLVESKANIVNAQLGLRDDTAVQYEYAWVAVPDKCEELVVIICPNLTVIEYISN